MCIIDVEVQLNVEINVANQYLDVIKNQSMKLKDKNNVERQWTRIWNIISANNEHNKHKQLSLSPPSYYKI